MHYVEFSPVISREMRKGNVFPLGRVEMAVFGEARNEKPQIIYHAGYSLNVWHFKASTGLHFNTDSYRDKKFKGKNCTPI